MASDKKLDIITHKQKLTTYKNYKAVPCTQLKRKRTALFLGSSALLLISAIILIWLILSVIGITPNKNVWDFFNKFT